MAVQVVNVAPVVQWDHAADVVVRREPQTFVWLTDDPGASESFSATPRCGAGNSLVGSTFNSITGSGTVTCRFKRAATASVSVAVADGDGGVTTTSHPVEFARARPDRFKVDEDVAVDLDVLRNDEPAGGTVVSFTQPAHGTVAPGTDGRLRYTPASDYSGPDSFTYLARWGSALVEGSVTIRFRTPTTRPRVPPVDPRTL
jgi:hypothetical protein